jgi:HEAT repeat protein
MVIQRIATISTLVLALAGPLAAQTPDPPSPEVRPSPEARPSRPPRPPRTPGNIDLHLPPMPPLPPFEPEALYDQARNAIENSDFDRALRELDQVIGQTNGRADAAMYWKAYSQSRLALSKEALETIKEMAKQFAASPWVKDAKALELEIRQAAGQPISAELQNDEELKLLALRGVMQTDPDKGLPIIEKMLAGGAAPRVRDRALFVLSQSRSPKARDIMVTTAKNNANPELQLRAIRYLGFMGNDDRDLLPGIYRTSTDASVKRAVMNTLFMQRNAKGLVDLARSEKDTQMKKEIVSKLSVMKAPEATDYLLELLK